MTGATEILRPSRRKLVVPKQPVTTVTSVEAITANGPVALPAGSWTWNLDRVIHLHDSMTWPSINACPPDHDVFAYRVTFDYGWSTFPDDLVGLVSDMVNRTIWGPMSTGVVGETIGEYSYQMQQGMGTMGTGIRLLPRDQTHLKNLGYRPLPMVAAVQIG